MTAMENTERRSKCLMRELIYNNIKTKHYVSIPSVYSMAISFILLYKKILFVFLALARRFANLIHIYSFDVTGEHSEKEILDAPGFETVPILI